LVQDPGTLTGRRSSFCPSRASTASIHWWKNSAAPASPSSCTSKRGFRQWRATA